MQQIIYQNSTPIEPQLQIRQIQAEAQQTPLKELDGPAFAQQAAQRLGENVRSQELSPAQVREAAANLGQEAERPLNLSVITTERLNRDIESARQGQVQGFEKMFQETSGPAQAKLM